MLGAAQQQLGLEEEISSAAEATDRPSPLPPPVSQLLPNGPEDVIKCLDYHANANADADADVLHEMKVKWKIQNQYQWLSKAALKSGKVKIDFIVKTHHRQIHYMGMK